MGFRMRSLCVFCGSSPGNREAYSRAALDLADYLATCDIELVYGAGSIGLMGVLADRVLERGGRVTGVIPRYLASEEILHGGLSRTHIVESLLERKLLMMELADGFVALPGGLGTFDELFEVYTWLQLGRHRKPVGLLNCMDYFDPFLQMVDHSVREGFTRADHRKLVRTAEDPASLVEEMMQWLREQGG